MSGWPADWSDRVSGADCPMCRSPRADEDEYGIRVQATEHTDAVLQRAAVQRGYALVIWRGRHVVEPFELSDSEAAAYWLDVLAVARALAEYYRPIKINYETLGNSVPHLHTHLVPRYVEDPAPGRPFPLGQSVGAADPRQLRLDAAGLRALLVDPRTSRQRSHLGVADGRLECGCGQGIVVDDSADDVPYKAHRVPDQDWTELLDADPVDAVADRVRDLSRPMWQCSRCGRLHLVDGSGRVWPFAPERPDVPRRLLASVHGARWKGQLTGYFRSSGLRGPAGELSWSCGAGDDGREWFRSRADLERRYHEEFARLRDADILRSASLRVDGRWLHEWAAQNPYADRAGAGPGS